MKKVILFTGLFCLLSFTFISKKDKTPKGFIFVPSMTTDIDGKAVSIQSFFMAEHEVTNHEYRDFLNHLKRDGKDSLYQLAYPDTAAWNIGNWHMQPMVDLYFWHPAYDNYPVVNITPEGANLYCIWLTEQLRETYSDRINDVRLPTKYEWIGAAKGGLENVIYPWSGPYLQNAKGCYLANFTVIGDHNIQRTKDGLVVVSDSTFVPDMSLIDGAITTAQSVSYSPNGYGLYNMSGNVAELTHEKIAMGGHWHSTGYDIRITSEQAFEKANPFTGFRPVMTYLKPSTK